MTENEFLTWRETLLTIAKMNDEYQTGYLTGTFVIEAMEKITHASARRLLEARCNSPMIMDEFDRMYDYFFPSDKKTSKIIAIMTEKVREYEWLLEDFLSSEESKRIHRHDIEHITNQMTLLQDILKGVEE